MKKRCQSRIQCGIVLLSVAFSFLTITCVETAVAQSCGSDSAYTDYDSTYDGDSKCGIGAYESENSSETYVHIYRTETVDIELSYTANGSGTRHVGDTFNGGEVEVAGSYTELSSWNESETQITTYDKFSCMVSNSFSGTRRNEEKISDSSELMFHSVNGDAPCPFTHGFIRYYPANL